MKIAIAIISGIVAGLLIYFLGITVFRSIYPYPSNLDLTDALAYQSFIDQLPTKAHVIKIIVDAFTIFAAGLVASIINSKYRPQAGILAVIPFLILMVYNDFSYNYPTYFTVIDITVGFIVAFTTIMFGSRRIIS